MRASLFQRNIINKKKYIMVLNKIKNTITKRIPRGISEKLPTQLKGKVKVTGKKRDQVLMRRIEKLFVSAEGYMAITKCGEAVQCALKLDDVGMLNSLIDFTLSLHQFRKIHKPDLRFIEKHINGLSEGPVGEFINILKGDHGQMHIFFDTKHFKDKGFYRGIIFTSKGQTVTLGELMKSISSLKTVTKFHRDIIFDVREYMSRTVELMEIIKEKKY